MQMYRHIFLHEIYVWNKWKNIVCKYLSTLYWKWSNEQKKGVTAIQRAEEKQEREGRGRANLQFILFLCMHECITWFWRSFWLIQLVAALKSSKRQGNASGMLFLSAFYFYDVGLYYIRYCMCHFYLPFCPWHTMPMSLSKSMCNVPHSNTFTHTHTER